MHIKRSAVKFHTINSLTVFCCNVHSNEEEKSDTNWQSNWLTQSGQSYAQHHMPIEHTDFCAHSVLCATNEATSLLVDHIDSKGVALHGEQRAHAPGVVRRIARTNL